MQFLTALLAFAAIMALMSTIVAVVIEAIINLLGMRSAGLRRLLEGYYRTAVAPRLPPGSELRGTGSEARAFAAAVTANPAHQPGLGPAGPRRFNHLTTRQLVEQFARTPAGSAFLALDDAQLRPHLEALAYEFDRYSAGARDFFSRRTRNVSVVIALILAFALNIDALRLYRTLATNQAAADRVVAVMQERETQTGGQTFAAAGGTTEEQLDELLVVLTTMNIPVGFTQYPYCSDYSPFLGIVNPDSPVYDKRCDRVARLVGPEPQASVEASAEPGDIPSMLAQFRSPEKQQWWMRNFEVRSHSDTALWFFSVLVAGGMIGLGAPFWFNVYRRLALLVPIVGAASALASRPRAQPTQGGEVVTTTPAEGRRDDANVRGSDSLVVAARTAAGQSPDVPAPAGPGGTSGPNLTGSSPPGTAIGAGSAQRVAASGTTGEATTVRMRVLRG